MGTLILLSTSLPICPDLLVEGLGDWYIGLLYWNVILQRYTHLEAWNTSYVIIISSKGI